MIRHGPPWVDETGQSLENVRRCLGPRRRRSKMITCTCTRLLLIKESQYEQIAHFVQTIKTSHLKLKSCAGSVRPHNEATWETASEPCRARKRFGSTKKRRRRRRRRPRLRCVCDKTDEREGGYLFILDARAWCTRRETHVDGGTFDARDDRGRVGLDRSGRSGGLKTTTTTGTGGRLRRVDGNGEGRMTDELCVDCSREAFYRRKRR